MRLVRIGSLVLAVVLSVLPVAKASAEWQGDIFFGGSCTPKTWLDIDATLPLLGGQRLRAADKIEIDDSVNVGGRVGYWLEGLKWFGVGLDVMHWRPDIPDQAASKLTRATILSGLRE